MVLKTLKETKIFMERNKTLIALIQVDYCWSLNYVVMALFIKKTPEILGISSIL